MKDLERFTEQKIIQLTLAVTRNLVTETPVDIGWAKANWVPSLGQPFLVDLTDVDPEAELSIAEVRRSTGEAEVINFSLNQGPVYITNNVPYIRRLNEGHSQQAPAGFVQIEIVKAVRTI